MGQTLRLLEIATVFLLIEARIWIFHQNQNYKIAAVLLPLTIILIRWGYQENPKTLGLRPEKSWRGFSLMITGFLILIAAIVGLSAYYQPAVLKSVSPILILSGILKYFPWALFQQLCLNGYFANSLYVSTENRSLAVILSALLFAIVHLPNPVLTIFGFIGGLISANFFLTNRNLYPLAVGHAILGTAVRYLLPVAWHHDLTIGYGFINF